MFYSNYIILCNKIGKAPSAVAEENGFKRSVVTRWSKGAMPRQASIQKLADYFGVPVSELVGELKHKLFYEKYLQLCRKKGVSPSKAALDMGFTKTTVSRWKKGGGITDINAITVADYLGVSVSALVDEPEQKGSSCPEAEEARETDNVTAELMSLWRAASPEQRQLYLKILKVMEDEHAEK